MSKLTNCQIRALIPSMEATLAGASQRGDATAARRVMRRIEAYRDELRRREAVELDPAASEIQESHIVPVRAEKAFAKARRKQRVEYLVEVGGDGGEFRGTVREALDLWDEYRQLAKDKLRQAYKVTPISLLELRELAEKEGA